MWGLKGGGAACLKQTDWNEVEVSGGWWFEGWRSINLVFFESLLHSFLVESKVLIGVIRDVRVVGVN